MKTPAFKLGMKAALRDSAWKPRALARVSFIKFACIVSAGLFFICIFGPSRIYAQNYSAQKYFGYLDAEEDEEAAQEEDEYEEPKLRETVVKGSYRFNFGVEKGDFKWKDANYLLQEGSWRYFFGEKRYNTYDPAIYNNFKLSIDAPFNEKLSFYTKIVVDPWSFVGKSKVTTIPSWYGSTNANDPVEIQLKYWSNSGRIFPEIVRSEQGDSFALPETTVVDGYTQPVSVLSDWGSNTHRIDLPSLKIDREFKPIKAFWFDLKEDEYRAILFLYAEENISM
ncbi:MAG: hypothetical protein U9R31_03375, partial [Candidatus Omnitrophota bacterium]|nr:hypothetical protein [Candidatus Omnitrophota bacterium]